MGIILIILIIFLYTNVKRGRQTPIKPIETDSEHGEFDEDESAESETVTVSYPRCCITKEISSGTRPPNELCHFYVQSGTKQRSTY